MDDDKVIEAMTLAMCNSIRKDNDLPPIRSLEKVERPDHYRRQAQAALKAYRRAALGH